MANNEQLKVLLQGQWGAWNKRTIENHDKEPALIYKDLHYLVDLAFRLKRPLLLVPAVKEMYGMTYSRGEAGLLRTL